MQHVYEFYSSEEVDVICEALIEWCRSTRTEPDQMLMFRAIDLYKRGNRTADQLLTALKRQLSN
jgi:hypothetical protein